MRSALRGGALLLAGVSLVATGCSTTGAATGGSRGAITRAQILELADVGGTALSVVQQLRPRWLRARNPGGPSSGGRPLYAEIFVDSQRLGPLEYLSEISSQVVQRIEYLDFRDATIRYGEGYPGGIIRVVTRPTGEAPPETPPWT